MLSTPPAFILSQDQTLVKNVCIRVRIAWQFCSCLLFWFDIFRCPFLKNLFKEFSGFVVYCSVINVLFCCCRFMRQLLYYIKVFHVCQQLFYFFFAVKNVNIKFDIFSCFYRFAVLHNTYPVLLYIFTFRQRNSKAATAANLSRSLFPFLCKLLYLFLE